MPISSITLNKLTVMRTLVIYCLAATAKGHGFEPADIHGFVTMVPMADAEIIRLQQAGYAYMR